MRRLRLRDLGLQPYLPTWQAMQSFIESRDATTLDELWLVQHPPVYTLGHNGDPANLLDAGDIPVVRSDRGGQITYHGPGQLVAYALFDLKRLNIGVRGLVSGLENAVINTLASYGIRAEARRDAPGVYVANSKIASLGLRIRHGCSYHGLSLNVDLNLAPFRNINPCGFKNLQVTRLTDLGAPVTVQEVTVPLIGTIMQEFGFDGIQAHEPGHCHLALKEFQTAQEKP